ncbi:cationic amino acid transporter 4 [Lycorma delicatula]|uniref:cationic amino acid transporter 4 n=1 Tax=Lycorma delicatula TaxID=130591 RepID=UPI003F51519A
MPGSRHMILGHIFSGFCSKMNRTKQMETEEEALETPLKRCLTTFDITLLGVGHMVGAGIYVLTGTVAKDQAGPGIIISFLLAGMTSMLAALCYAEFGTRVPKAGSAYIYTYVSIGEFWAFIIGWNIILEHMIGAASVARAWSGYVDSLLGNWIANFTMTHVGELHEELLGKYPDFVAFSVCIFYASLLGLGVKGSAMVNSVFTIINLGVIGLIIVLGLYYADINNWFGPRGFLPYGIHGVVAGAATCFYAFVGFDSIATSGEEARDPTFSIPLATILSMTLVCFGYILVSAALTLMVPFYEINPTAALPEAFSSLDLPWAKYIVSLGALCGMTTTLLGSLFSLPRCMYAMAQDGLLFSFLGRVNETTQVPLINLAVSGLFSAIIALVFDLEKLVEFMSIGTLLAYTIVSASVIILRYRPRFTPLLTREDSSLSDIGATTSPSGVIEYDIGPAGRLKQSGWSRWMLEPIVGRCEPGAAVSASVFVFTCFSGALCIHLHFWEHSSWWSTLSVGFIIAGLIGCLIVIESHEQNSSGLRFKVPFVPYVPALSILCNVELMTNLNQLTWLRFIIWMTIGLMVYFLYGIHHSKENDTSNTYSVLLTSNEAGKFRWGSIQQRPNIGSKSLSTDNLVH